MRLAFLCLITLVPAAALAVPPVQQFPASTSPANGAALPANGRVLIFGSNAIALADVGLALSVDGAPVAVDTALVGCCTVELALAPDVITIGAAVDLLVSAAVGDSTFSFVGAAAADVAPALGVPEVVQVVTATRLVAPMTPAEGPAWVLTLDVPDVENAAALATYDESGALITIEPTAGAVFERLITGAVGAERTEACITVEARASSGETTRAVPVCATLPPHEVTGDGDGDDDGTGGGGCASTPHTSLPVFAALAAFVAPWRRRRRPSSRVSLAVLGVIALGACDGRAFDVDDSGRLCADAYADHTFPASAFSDGFFDERSREEYGWVAVKGLIIEPHDGERRRVGFYDNDFFILHDEWFYFRLMNGHAACGADEIVPLDSEMQFDDVESVKEWARAQDRLPPFVSWAGERLTAPDFYRLSRNTEPRVYVPFYLTRDVDEDARAYAMRVAGSDVLNRDTLAAIFSALDPLMPDGAPLYWTPAYRRPAQRGFAEELIATGDPLGTRVRFQ